MSEYENLADSLTSVKGKRFSIVRFEMTPGIVMMEKMRAMRRGPKSYQEVADLKPGSFIKLVDNERHECVMSDTPMERRTNREFVDRAHGDVLIGGLGIGMVLAPILKKPEVRTVTVIERHQEVIDLFWKSGHKKNPKLTVVCADADDYAPAGFFDVIYFDIWNTIGGGHWPQMKRLKLRYRKHLRRDSQKAWLGCWREKDMRRCAENDEVAERETHAILKSFGFKDFTCGSPSKIASNATGDKNAKPTS